MKKIYLLCMILLLSLCFTFKDVYALEDIIPPIIDASLLKVSNTNATVGDNVKISLSVIDDSGVIKYVALAYIRPITKNTKIIYLNYNDETNFFEYEFVIDESYQYGLWR